MRHKIRRSAVLVFGLLILAQFNNCDTAQTASGIGALASMDPSVNLCNGDTCTYQNAANLSVTANYSSSIGVLPGLKELNIAGDCNEGGFPTNLIRWELQLNIGGTKRTMRSSVMTYNGRSMNGQCVRGRFQLDIYLGPIAEDMVDRSGLKYGNGSNPTTYTLKIDIIGYDSNGQPYTNSLMSGEQTLYLIPVQ